MGQTISYRIQMEGGREHRFEVSGPDQDLEVPDDPPTWAKLDVERCDRCPLRVEEHPYCPAAIACQRIANAFAEDLSIARVDVTVETEERQYFKNVDLQTCLRSLYGLLMANCGCPVLARMRPMARFHLPFATLEETMVRVVGTYLTKQYLRMRAGEPSPDWELTELAQLYQELESVNRQLMRRMRHASHEDANINALQTFVSFSFLANLGFEEMLRPVAPIIVEGF